MKAAVLKQLGTPPVYEDIEVPKLQNEEQITIDVKAAAIHNLDKIRASGHHYANYTNLPTAIGFDGVGTLEDGTTVYAQGLTGMMAEKALVSKNNYIKVPKNLNLQLAAAIPNATLGSAMALLKRAKFQKGACVLINGATGVTGNMAVQLAKYYGASKIIVTGRHSEILEKLKEVGATKTISLREADDNLLDEMKEINRKYPVDMVIDYLWGKPTEILIKALSTKSGSFARHIRLVTVGQMAGATINLPSGVLRSSGIEILGSGIGSLTEQDMIEYKNTILPEVFQLAAEGKISMNVQTEKLKDIEDLWSEKAVPGSKMVVQVA